MSLEGRTKGVSPSGAAVDADLGGSSNTQTSETPLVLPSLADAEQGSAVTAFGRE